MPVPPSAVTTAGSTPQRPATPATPAEGAVRQAAASEPLPPPKPAGKSPGPLPLSLAELEALALAHNPTLPAAQALVTQEQGTLRQETLLPNPTAGYVRTDADQSDASSTNGVFLSQDVVTAGKLRLAGDAGRLGVAARTWQVAAQQGRVVNDVRLRFLDARGARDGVEVADEVERLTADEVRVAKALVEAKQAARLDVLQTEIQLDLARAAAEEARHRERAARRQLANVVGLPTLPAGELVGGPDDADPDPDWDRALDRLLSASPVVKAQELEVRGAEADLRLARAEAVPNLNVQVVLQRDRTLKATSVSTLLSAPLPLFNRNQGNILRAVGFLEQQRRELERVRLALRDLLSTSFQQYETARDQARRLRADVLPKARENLDLTSKGYAAGQFDLGRVLAARQAYAQARLAYVEAVTTRSKAAVEIEGLQLTGGLNPTEIGTALQSGAAAGGGGGARSVLLQQLQQRGNGGSSNLPAALQAAPR